MFQISCRDSSVLQTVQLHHPLFFSYQHYGFRLHYRFSNTSFASVFHRILDFTRQHFYAAFFFFVPAGPLVLNRTLTYRLVITANRNAVVCLLYGLSGMLMFVSEVDWCIIDQSNVRKKPCPLNSDPILRRPKKKIQYQSTSFFFETIVRLSFEARWKSIYPYNPNLLKSRRRPVLKPNL